MKTILNLSVLLIGFVGFSQQTTGIENSCFEQTLIDLGIDSDGILNQQVLTSDINQITHLDLSVATCLPITNLIGLEDFTALEVLDISGIGFINEFVDDIPPYLNLSTLVSLEELYFTQGSVHENVLFDLVLRNNPNLTKLESLDVGWLEYIDLEGSDVSLNNLLMNFTGDWQDICVNVTNPVAAQNAQGIYGTWDVTYTAQTGVLSYSDDCDILSVSLKDKVIFTLYPNPVTNNFYIESTQDFEQVEIYTLQGRLIKTFLPQENYNIAELPSGLYFVKVKGNRGSTTQKIVKQ